MSVIQGKKDGRGGARQGSGRKCKYEGYGKTTTIRVPERSKERIIKLIEQVVDSNINIAEICDYLQSIPSKDFENEVNMEKSNEEMDSLSIVFTKDEHKKELIDILNDDRIQSMMPECIRDKNDMMILWVTRYFKGLLELGMIDNKSCDQSDSSDTEFEISDIGMLYYRLEKHTHALVNDISQSQNAVKKLAERMGLSDKDHPCLCDVEFEDEKVLMYVEIDFTKFEYRTLHSFLTTLDQGGAFHFEIIIKDNHVRIRWDVSSTQAWVEGLERWRDIVELHDEYEPDYYLDYSESEYALENMGEGSFIEENEEMPLEMGNLLNDEIALSDTTKGSRVSDVGEQTEYGTSDNVPGYTVVTPEEEAEIVRLLQSGMSCNKISTIVGRSWDAVKRIREKFNIEPKVSRKQKKFPSKKEKDVISAYLSGLSLKQIRKKWNISDSVIDRILRNNGIERSRLKAYKNLSGNRKS